jgi:hypothetical protein
LIRKERGYTPMKVFNQFAAHPFGSWVINGLAVVAFIIVLKMLVNRFPDAGPLGATKSAINAV